MFGVPGHDVQPVPPCGGRDQTVTGGHNLPYFLRGGREFSPNVAGFEIHGQDVISVMSFHILQPHLEIALLLAFLEKSNSFRDFPNRQNADKQIITLERLNSPANTGMSLWAAQFGEHTGIQ
jgi:hypothetical protein